MQQYHYYIAGEFKNSREKFGVMNPFNGEKFAEVFETAPEDVFAALEKAKAAQKIWRKNSFKERAVVLREIAKAIFDNMRVLAELETKEIGKSFKESLFVDVPLAAECFEYYASFLETLSEESLPGELGMDFVSYDAYGVVGVYLPYNVPLMIFGFSCAAALAAGNALVIKPSEYGSLSLLELAKYLDRLGLPKGLINIVSGKGSTVGKALASSDIDLISFTGARETLKKLILQTADNPKKIICELGGANISVLFSDADRESAMQNILAAAFMKQGQICIGTSILLIEEPLYNDFVCDLVERVQKIKLGDPFSPDTGLGPLPTKKHLEIIQEKVDRVVEQGARILWGGKPLDGEGLFYPPTVIEVKEVMYEEFFAPVIMVKSFRNKEEAEKICEENPTGLVLHLWTKDQVQAEELAAKARCGTVWINTFAQMGPHTPFGGTGKSGWGRNLGRLGFFEYVQPKHISIGLKSSPVCGWFGV